MPPVPVPRPCSDPSTSYCNRYSAYWRAGNLDCPAGSYQEEWYADFAAWAWQNARVHFSYGQHPAEINGAPVSFYEWEVANDEWWHPAPSGCLAAPRDVALYASRSWQIRRPCAWRSSQTTRPASTARTW